MKALIWLGFFLGSFNLAGAATLYLDPSTTAINRGDAVTLALRLDTDESIQECVNTADVVISYPDNIDPVDVSIGRSIIPIWVEPPVINKANRTITMAGGIPSGYCGRIAGDPRLTNVIAEMIFRAPGPKAENDSTSSTALISIEPESTLYLNDGYGTKANTAFVNATIAISNQIGEQISDEWHQAVTADVIKPEAFSITLERDPAGINFNGQYYIVFNTTDKQTGLSHYEVIEEPIDQMSLFGFGAATAPWIKARSPYTLRDQTLNSAIRVKAVDKAGNEYVASFLPPLELRQDITNIWLLISYGLGAGLLLLLMITGLLFLVRSRRYKKSLNSNQTGFDNQSSI